MGTITITTTITTTTASGIRTPMLRGLTVETVSSIRVHSYALGTECTISSPSRGTVVLARITFTRSTATKDPGSKIFIQDVAVGITTHRITSVSTTSNTTNVSSPSVGVMSSDSTSSLTS